MRWRNRHDKFYMQSITLQLISSQKNVAVMKTPQEFSFVGLCQETCGSLWRDIVAQGTSSKTENMEE